PRTSAAAPLTRRRLWTMRLSPLHARPFSTLRAPRPELSYRAIDQLGRLYRKRPREPQEHRERRVAPSAFEQGRIRAVNPRAVCQPLLRDSLLAAHRSQRLSEGLRHLATVDSIGLRGCRRSGIERASGTPWTAHDPTARTVTGRCS